MTFEDDNFAGHAGWKEIVVSAPEGILIRSSVPTKDRSSELSNYPTDLLNSPPQDFSAAIQFSLPVSTSVASATEGSGALSGSAHAVSKVSHTASGHREKGPPARRPPHRNEMLPFKLGKLSKPTHQLSRPYTGECKWQPCSR